MENIQNQERPTVTLYLCVAGITFRAPDTGYTVLRCNDNESPDAATAPITATGTFPGIQEGISIFATGEWVTHPKFGKQFRVDSWREELPATDSGIRKYLSSGLVYGIGPILADRLVDAFGKDTFDVIENHPERLNEVQGVGKKKIESIRKKWKEQKAVRDIMVFLKDHNVTDTLAAKIYRQYGDESIKILSDNPYRMADDVWGVGFKIADHLALNLGIDRNSPFRIRSGLKYALEEAKGQGHMYLPEAKLLQNTIGLLSLDSNEDTWRKIGEHVEELSATDKLVRLQPSGETYLPQLYTAETYVAEKLKKLSSSSIALIVPPDINRIEKALGLMLAPAQRDAVMTALSGGVTVITGGPGTGKTTTVRAILTGLEQAYSKVLLCSPTGKAAKRLEETTGREATTIHRLLEFAPAEGGFQRHENNPLRGDALIVDEASMIDGQLLHYLLRAVPSGMRVILVGDADQLPSVGAGNCLREIIASRRIPTVRLTQIFRQAEGSDIITGAHAVNSGRLPNLSGRRDLWFQNVEDPEPTADTVINTIRYLTTNGTPSRDIQVLTPMRRGPVGTEELNRRIQNVVNPHGKAVQKGAHELRIGDRVVNLKNDYENLVFNGDQGVITEYDEEEQTFTVKYDGREVIYTGADADHLMLAYAMTIHRSQGSEFPVVIVVMSTQHWIMLQRTLLYTAITRAKNLCFITGSYRAITQAVHNNAVKHRYTLLGQLLNA